MASVRDAQSGLTLTETAPKVLFQDWLDLCFFHYSLEPASVQPLVPEGVQLDLFPDENGKERAWIGLIAFRLTHTRPRFLPSMPYLGTFAELNVRTYVRGPSYEPSVLFLSLDGPRRLTNFAARLGFGVPYMLARTELTWNGRVLGFSSNRTRERPARTVIKCVPGEPMGTTCPGTLEAFLTHRYAYFAQLAGKLWHGRVEHPPYELRRLERIELESNHAASLGLPQRPWSHACYCEGVKPAFYKPESKKPSH